MLRFRLSFVRPPLAAFFIWAGLLTAAMAAGGAWDVESRVVDDPRGPSLTGGRMALLGDAVTTSGFALRDPDMQWVNASLASMTLDEKIGQLIVSSQHSSGVSLINNYKVGGFIFLGNNQNAADIVDRVNDLQAASPFPLWFSIDAEAGLGARVADATIYPLLMAFGAANDPALAAACGRITARECRALGIQVAYAPVLDVNTEPINPIISTRAFSDKPSLPAALGKALSDGAHEEGILCTFKHYPGHGATAGDSHSSLPLVDVGVETMYAVHIKPYSEILPNNDKDLVMTAHVWYSAFYPDGAWPATLGSIFNKDILRDEIGFDGILISDSFDMAGLAVAVPDLAERTVVGLESGLDVILNPPDVGQSFNGIKSAVIGGRLTEARIDESVRRVLIAKSRTGLPEMTAVNPALWPGVLNHPDHLATVRAVCEKGFTKVASHLPSPPVQTTDKALVLTLASTQRIFYRMPSDFFTDHFAARVAQTTVRSVPVPVGSSERNEILAQAAGFDVVIVAGYDWWRINSSSHVTLINALSDLSVPVIYVGFGAPYHGLQIPGVDAFYCGYSSPQAMQEVAAEVLVGEREAVGVLPVYLDGLGESLGWMAR